MGRPLARQRVECEALLEELFGYLDGELSAARCRMLERHLDACPCCGYLAVRLRRAIAVCKTAGQSRLPLRVRRQALARVAGLLGPVASDAAHPARASTPRTTRRPRSR
jgi:anti-sigma factor RsiW